MLDAHAELTIPPETQFIPVAAQAWSGRSDSLGAALRAMTEHRCWGDLDIDIHELRMRLSSSPPRDFGDVLRAMFALYAERHGKPRWGDKSSNYTPHLRLIATLLPEAHFVHIIRDGRDVFLSIRDLWFGPTNPTAGAHWWRHLVAEARRTAPEKYLEIQYEDLVRAPERTLQGICRFLRLPWDDGMLRYYETAPGRIEAVRRDVRARGQLISGDRRVALAARTTKPLDSSRIQHWRTDMAEDDQSAFVAIAGDLLEQLGYPLV